MFLGNLRVWSYLILANLFWAGNFIFGTYVVTEMTPLWISFARWSLALILLIPIALYSEKPNWRNIIKEWLSLLVMGILGIIGYNLVLLTALEYTTATNAALVSALNPAIIVLFSFFLLREKLSIIQAIGLVSSIFGVMVILTKGNLAEFFLTRYNKGDLLMVFAVIIWTIYSIIGKRLKTPPITATAVSTFFSIVILCPFALIEGMEISKFSPMAVTGIMYMAIFPCVAAFILWNIAVREIGVSKSGVSMNLIPVFTAVIAIAVGGEITNVQIFGGIFVFLGVYLTTGLLDQRFKIIKENKQM